MKEKYIRTEFVPNFGQTKVLGCSDTLKHYRFAKNPEGQEIYKRVGIYKKKPPIETPIPFAAGQIVKTRKGHIVRIVCADRVQSGIPPQYPIVGLELSDGTENIRIYDMRGQYGDHSSEYDLVPLTQKSEEVIELVLDDPS